MFQESCLYKRETEKMIGELIKIQHKCSNCGTSYSFTEDEYWSKYNTNCPKCKATLSCQYNFYDEWNEINEKGVEKMIKVSIMLSISGKDTVLEIPKRVKEFNGVFIDLDRKEKAICYDSTALLFK